MQAILPKISVVLAGNPNCGKTTVFNKLTGSRQHVGNYAGVTVEKKEGYRKARGMDITVVDLPGIYSLTAFSPEEVVARDYIVRERPDVVVNVLDAANLERNLYLTVQLMELERPMILALNMMDILQESGVTIDVKALSDYLQIPVVCTVGCSGHGVTDLLDSFFQANYNKPTKLELIYAEPIEKAVKEIVNGLAMYKEKLVFPLRWMGLRLLENDQEAVNEVQALPSGEQILALVKDLRVRIVNELGQEPQWLIAEKRYEFVHDLYLKVVSGAVDKIKISSRIDKVLTHRVLGLPIFFALMWFVFYLVFTLGIYPQEWIEAGMIKFGQFVGSFIVDPDLNSLLVDGVISGVGSVLSFMPNILMLFFAISLLEDTGYMARAAFLMDKIMHKVGLHGKSFIPLLLGFGCSVPAIMSTRTLENRRDRMITILVAPFMSCSARLPVYMVLTAAFFDEKMASNVLFGIYFLGIVLAVVVAKIFSTVLFTGTTEPFVMELPPYHAPVLRNTMLTMWERSVSYIRKAGTIILAVTVLVWYATNYPHIDTYSQNYNQIILSAETSFTEKITKEVLEPLAISNINARPELVKLIDQLMKQREDHSAGINSLSVGQYRAQDVRAAEKYVHFLSEIEQVKKSVETQKAGERLVNSYAGRLGRSIEPLIKPLGFDWKIGIGLIAGFSAKEILVSTLGTIYSMGSGLDGPSTLKAALVADPIMNPLVAMSLMVFVLVYAPCFATIVVIKRETGSWKWALFSLVYTTVLAWVLSFIVYQGGKMLGLV